MGGPGRRRAGCSVSPPHLIPCASLYLHSVYMLYSQPGSVPLSSVAPQADSSSPKERSGIAGQRHRSKSASWDRSLGD